MNAKKVLGFIFCSSAFTKRNISSIGLVLIFFLVYILAGGKIDTRLPNANQAGVFGGGNLNGDLQENRPNNSSAEVLGATPSGDRTKREAANLQQGRIFTDDEAQEASNEAIDRSGLITGKQKEYGTERERNLAEKREEILRKEADPFDALEERLKRSQR